MVENSVKVQRGSITKKPGSNKIYLDFRYYGRRIVKSTGLPDTPANRAKAIEFLNRIIRKIDENTFRFADAFPGASKSEKELFAKHEGWEYKPDPQNVLIGDYIKTWTENIFKDFDSESKKRDYESIIKYWIIPFFEQKNFLKITQTELKQFIATLKYRKGKNIGKNLSRSRCNNILLPLREIWGDACSEFHWNLKNPFINIYKLLPKKPNHKEIAEKRKVFRFDDMMLVLAHLKPKYRLATEFMLRTGAIGSELAGLRKSDVAGDYIYFRNSIVRGHEKPGLKTEYRTRDCEICTELRKIIDAAMLRSEGEHLFLTSTGMNFAEGTYRKNGWTPALKRAGLPYCSPYSLRHTFAAWCLAIGMHPDRLVVLMGHNSRQMVYEVYGRYTKGLEADAPKILEFFGPDFLAPQ